LILLAFLRERSLQNAQQSITKHNSSPQNPHSSSSVNTESQLTARYIFSILLVASYTNI